MPAQQDFDPACDGGLCQLETADVGGGEVYLFREIKYAVALPVGTDMPPQILGRKLGRQEPASGIYAAEAEQNGHKVNKPRAAQAGGLPCADDLIQKTAVIAHMADCSLQRRHAAAYARPLKGRA